MKNAAPITVGMKADEVLRSDGRARWAFIHKPRQTGKDECGLTVEWYYDDCTVVFKRLTFPGPYQVIEVRPRESKEAARARLFNERKAAEAGA